MARTMSIQAVQELYGINSCEEKSVTDAWYAVGVGAAFTGNVIINYVPQITGADAICGVNSIQNYTTNLPAGATAVWTPSNANISIAVLTPNGSDVAVTNLSNTSTTQFLTATITSTQTGGCNPQAGTYIANKLLKLGMPNCSTRVAYWYVNGYQTPLGNCALLTQIRCTNSNVLSQCEYYATAWLVDPNASTITWSYVSSSGYTFWAPKGPKGDSVEVVINYNSPNGWLRLKCTTTNACGSYNWDFWFTPQGSNANCPVYLDQNCLIISRTEITKTTQEKIILMPNPTNGQFAVSLKTKDKNAVIKEIIITNKMGIPVYQQKFVNKQKRQTVNLINQPTDVYIVEVFDGIKWVTEKLSLQR